MGEQFNMLKGRLKGKGFVTMEIPRLLRDAFRSVREGMAYSIVTLNRELEDLGWGIRILDRNDLIISLLNRGRSNFRKI